MRNTWRLALEHRETDEEAAQGLVSLATWSARGSVELVVDVEV